ncbi:MAG: hypothetical protein ACJ788_24190, partial [Ktedonobacteraceae bacterium]
VLSGSGQLTPSLTEVPPTTAALNKPRSTGLLSSMNKLAASAPAQAPAPVNELSKTNVAPDQSQSSAHNTPAPPTRSRLGVKPGLLRPVTGRQVAPATGPASDTAQATTGALPLTSSNPPAGSPMPSNPAWPQPAPHVTTTLSAPSQQSGITNTDAFTATKRSVSDPQSPFSALQTTGTLTLPNAEQGNTGTVKLTDAMKVVQVPVAGQPGRYVTGLLPMLPSASPSDAQGQTAPATAPRTFTLTRPHKILALVMLVLVILSSSGIFWYLHSRPTMPSKYGVQAEPIKPDLKAITAARATATTVANTILADPLNQNIHNWPVSTTGNKHYVFVNGAYHITDNDPVQSAPAILPDLVLKGPFVYSLKMDEIKGDDTSINNSFGMILRLSSHTVRGKNVVTFYCFEVVNNSDGKYQFVKYDSSSKASTPWVSIWQHPFGREFHQGHGPKNANTFKIVANGKHFTFFVNGKQVGTAQDSSLTAGEIGMLVNLKGTEVAFSNLLLTYR